MNLKKTIDRFRAWQKEPRQYTDQGLGNHCCTNCGHEFDGNFCPICGQNVKDGRITWHSVWGNFMRVWNIDSRSLPITLWQLLWRPGYLIGDYLDGHHQASHPPANMLFSVAIVYVLVVQLFGINDRDIVFSLPSDSVFASAVNWLTTHPAWGMLSVTMILILPTWCFFRFAPRHTRHSLPEGIFIQLYICSLLFICDFIQLIFSWGILLIPIYYYITYRQLFGYRFWGTLWRLILCFFVWINIIVFLGCILIIPTEDNADFLSTILILSLIFGIATAAILAFGYLISRKTSSTNQPFDTKTQLKTIPKQ